MKRALKVLGLTFLLYLGYTFVFGFLIFNLPIVASTDLSYDHEAMLEPSGEPTYAYLLEDLKLSLDSRLALIEEAEETINISYYTIHGGRSRDLFFGALLNQADQGVQVNIIIDYIFYYQSRDEAIYYEAVATHDNITVKLYEPYNPFLPYTIQNRLHDKLLLIDDHYGVIGGRNIGDRYYEVESDYPRKTFDRDVLVFGDDAPHSTVMSMNAYYEELFTHEYTVDKTVTRRSEHGELANLLKDQYIAYKTEESIDNVMPMIRNDAIPVNRATFMRSPLERFHKHPVILETLSAMAMEYDEWFVQSPYVIFSSLMAEYLPDPEGRSITVLTNNPALSTNLFAMSGYERYKNDISVHATLYEFQHEHSLHGKSMIFGDEVSVIGSYNLDPRSATLSTESVMVIHGETFTAHHQSVVDGYIAQSLEVDPDGNYLDDPGVEPVEMPFAKRVALRVVGMISYFFDSML